MSSELVQVLKKIGAPKVLVFGDLILDRYSWGETARISPEAPIPVLTLKKEESRPGSAANVVNVMRALGATVSCCGLVGDDAPGRELTRMVREGCTGETEIVIDPSRPTTVKTRFIGYVQSAGRAMHQILRVDAEETAPVAGEPEERLLAFLRRVAPQQDAVLVCDYNKGAISERLMRETIAIARAADVPVVCDPKLGKPPRFYAGINVMKPNRFETQALTGIKVHDTDSMLRAAQWLCPSVATDAVLISLDRDGMYLYERGGRGQHFPIQARAVHDITGAGDVVVGVMALMVAARAPYADAAQIANVAAGIEVGQVGCVPVARAEIIHELELRDTSLAAKIKTEADLVETLAEHRRRGQKIVFTNGCFDLLHVGHIQLLKFSRRQGDLLVVGINSDASVRAIKGPSRPILNQEERAHVLAAFDDVSYVVIFDDPSVYRLVGALRPDIIVKGGDYGTDEQVVGADIVKAYGGKVVRAPHVKGMSTTEIVTRILDAHTGARNGEEKP